MSFFSARERAQVAPTHTHQLASTPLPPKRTIIPNCNHPERFKIAPVSENACKCNCARLELALTALH